MKLKTIAIAISMMSLAASLSYAAEPVGYNRIVVPASSDVRLTIPFNQDFVGSHTVNSVTASGVTLTGPLAPGALANTHYVRFTSGKGEGLWSTISANSATSIDLENEDVLPFLKRGNTFRIYPHHKLSTVFPNSLFGVSFTNGSQVLIYDNDVDAMSINKSASKVGTYTSAGGGQWIGAGVNNNTILKPETQLILRNNAPQIFNVYMRGDVPDHAVSSLIAPSGDLVIGSGFPLPVILKQAGLNGNLRQVLFYDNAATGFNKSAVKVATFTTAGGGNWIGAGVTGNELIQPSEMITFRLPASEAGTKVMIRKPY